MIPLIHSPWFQWDRREVGVSYPAALFSTFFDVASNKPQTLQLHRVWLCRKRTQTHNWCMACGNVECFAVLHVLFIQFQGRMAFHDILDMAMIIPMLDAAQTPYYLYLVENHRSLVSYSQYIPVCTWCSNIFLYNSDFFLEHHHTKSLFSS